MSRIKNRLLSFYTQWLTKRHYTDRVNVGFDQAQTIGILYHRDSPKKQEVIHQLANQLKQLGKKVSVLCYVTGPRGVNNLTDSTVTLRDIPLLGKITHPQTKVFVETSFDYLYQVDLEGYPVIDYLLARSKAKCRVGHYTAPRAGLFEIMVSLAKAPKENDTTELAAQMLHYTQLIKTT